jgi:hypothetical protein
MGIATAATSLLLAGCSTPHLVNENTAAAQFARLGPGGKGIAQNFYDLGAGDTVKRLYWAQRRAQETGGVAEVSPVEKLQRKYVQIPVPENVQPDGTVQEAHTTTVEVVQLWEGVRK